MLRLDIKAAIPAKVAIAQKSAQIAEFLKPDAEGIENKIVGESFQPITQPTTFRCFLHDFNMKTAIFQRRMVVMQSSLIPCELGIFKYRPVDDRHNTFQAHDPRFKNYPTIGNQ